MTPSLSPDELYETLATYIDRGWPVLPLWGLRADGKTCACNEGAKCKNSAGKHPHRLAHNGVYSATLDPAMVRQWLKQAPTANWGIRCGMPMTGGKYLVVLDVDPRNGGFESLAQIQGARGSLPETVTNDSGGGGNHYLMAADGEVGSGTAGPGLDVIGAGKYIVVPPSLHESGKRYSWAFAAGPEDVEIATAPLWVIEATTSTSARPPRVGDGSARDTVLGEAFAIAGMLGPVFPDGCAAVKCPWFHEHSDQRGGGQDSSTVILPPAGGSRFGGFACKHAHCATRTWHDVIKALPEAAVAEAQRKFPMRPVAVVAMAEPVKTDGETKRDELKEVRERLSFKATKTGYKIVSDIVNLITILTYDPRWKGLLVWDEFSQVLRLVGDPPWHPDDKPKEPITTWSDNATTCLDSWLRRNWGMEIKKESIRDAAYVVAMRDSMNPVRDWLNGLAWDGSPRLERWLSTYLGSPDTPYVRAVGRKWMISAVARIMVPGCKADHLMVLEGKQGKGKSTALKILAGGDRFSDTPLEIGSKDAYLSLRGKWIYELAELASLNKSEADRAKAFFSSATDYYRPPYGKEMMDVPRQTVFCGTVNLGQYLKDSTGGRRFWPVVVGAIDFDGLEHDREQLWAEAVVLYKAGEIWWPAYEETAVFEEQQEQREIGDIWEDTITEFMNSEKVAKILAARGMITAAQIGEQALGIEVGKLGHGEQMRIGNVLQKLGYKRVRRDVDGKRAWGYNK